MVIPRVRRLSTEGGAAYWFCAAVALCLALAPANGAHANKPPNGSEAVVGKATLRIPTSSPRPQIAGLESDACFEIDEIVVNGIELLTVEELQPPVQPLAWRCMGNLLAKAIIGAINDAHAARGYVTTQGYVKPQDIRTSRRLEITVVTGRIGRIVTQEHDDDQTIGGAFARIGEAKGPWGVLSGVSGLWNGLAIWPNQAQLFGADAKTYLAMPTKAGDPLDINRIQQGIDQLNLSPSQRASAKLVPGAEPATSDVIVDVPRARSFRLGVGYEVNGSALSGKQAVANRVRTDIAKDNLLGLNDNWSATVASSVRSNEATAAFTLPVGWLTLAFNAGYSEYFSVLAPNVVLFQQISTAGINASYVVARDRNELTRITTSFTVRNASRFIDIFELSPQNVAYPRLGLLQTRFFDTAQLTYGLGWSHGLQAFGATVDQPDADYTVPKAQFVKLDAAASYIQLFKPYGVLRVDTSGQFSPTALFQYDQLVLGSVASVRGFARAPGFADSGGVVRLEFAPAVPIKDWLGDHGNDQLFYYDVASAFSPYVFSDAGGGYNVANSETITRVSVGAGLRFSLGRLTFDGSVGIPVSWSGAVPASGIGGMEAYLNLTVAFF
jgi:hemolysin activation/secretion protein